MDGGRRAMLHLLVILLVSVAIMWRQITTPEIFSCIREDVIYYVNWVRQYSEMIRQGTLYPRWMPDAHGGYGSPTFIFYAPLVVCLTAVSNIASGDIVLSVTLVKLTGLFLSGAFMYLFINEIMGGRAALFSALCYMLLPFRVFDLYFLGVFPSKFAFVWFPLILYFTGRAVSEQRPGRGVTGLAMSYALLCITHLLSGYMFAPVLFFYGLVVAGHGRLLTASLRIFGAAALGMSLAGFFLVPVLMEQRIVHLETITAKDWGRFYNNFLFHVMGPASPHNPPFYHYLGLTVLSTALVGAGAYAASLPGKTAGGRSIALFFVSLAIITLLLMTDASAPVWTAVPGMKMLIFPTRWSVVTVFTVACIVGVWAGTNNKTAKGRRAWVLALPLAAAVIWAGMLDREIVQYSVGFTRAELSGLPSGMEVEEYLPMTVSLSWLRDTINTVPSPRLTPLKRDFPVKIKVERWDGQFRQFTVSSGGDETIRVRTFYFPGWTAEVDGVETRIDVQRESGAMLIDVPAGSHDVRLRFKDTPDRLAGWAVTALAALLCVWLTLKDRVSATGGHIS